MLDKAEVAALEACDEHLKTLLAEFGVTLLAFGPGVRGRLKEDGEEWVTSISFSGAEWAWLEPLLEELKRRRESEADMRDHATWRED